MSGPPRRFYLVAVGAGFAFASMAIAVPLHVVAAHAQASVAGDVLALGTIAVAVGALAAGRYSAVLGPCDGMGTRPITKEISWST